MNEHIETLRQMRAECIGMSGQPGVLALDWALSLLAPENADEHAQQLQSLYDYEFTLAQKVVSHCDPKLLAAIGAGAAALIENAKLRERIAELESALTVARNGYRELWETWKEHCDQGFLAELSCYEKLISDAFAAGIEPALHTKENDCER